MPRTLCLILCLLVFFVLRQAAASADYCKLTCRRQDENTKEWKDLENSACKCKGAKKCVEVKEKRHEFRKWMLDEHNELRSKFALGNDTRWPNKVANMHALSYDYDLEHTLRYDELKFLDLDGNHSHIIDKYNHSVAREVPDGTKVGHFTQFVWAITTHIGCVRFYDEGQKIYHFGCNYAPAGNVDGQPMFIRGEPCSQCGNLTCNEQYKGICGEIIFPPAPAKSNCIQTPSFYFLLSLFIVYIFL